MAVEPVARAALLAQAEVGTGEVEPTRLGKTVSSLFAEISATRYDGSRRDRLAIPLDVPAELSVLVDDHAIAAHELGEGRVHQVGLVVAEYRAGHRPGSPSVSLRRSTRAPLGGGRAAPGLEMRGTARIQPAPGRPAFMTGSSRAPCALDPNVVGFVRPTRV